MSDVSLHPAGLPDRARVLIVDDQPANIRVLADSVGDGYRLFMAKTAARALEIAQSTELDLVLLDVILPDLDGFEVCRRLKSHEATRDIPVIFVTALEDVADEAKGFEAGGVDYITKPVSPPTVRARVNTHVELKRARDLLEELASVDSLTGIANRRSFDEALHSEWRRSLRHGSELSLALFDVDDFKLYNDRYGHAPGDECLRRVAATLASNWRRPGDMVARFGGEEFVGVLAGTGLDGLSTMVRRALGQVEALDIRHELSSCAQVVTLSAGGVSLRPDRSSSPERLVKVADELLYEAKRAGRNRAVLLDEENGARRVLSSS